MAKQQLHERALEMRKEGLSYSQIKEELNVSKGTLSIWLRDYPLSRERINSLRGNSEQRIERYRKTRAKNREAKQSEVYRKMSLEINTLSQRELFISGIILYWAEGTKASKGTIIMTNTDPGMLKFFMKWLDLMEVPRAKVKGYLHLYSDMDVALETKFWADSLSLPVSAFRKAYIKESGVMKRKNYKGRFGHGTCNIIVNDVKLYDRVMNGIEYIRTNYGIVGLPQKLTV